MIDTEEVALLINDCLQVNRVGKMNRWEHDFMLSIHQQLEVNNSLTDKQIETLEKIWERIT